MDGGGGGAWGSFASPLIILDHAHARGIFENNKVSLKGLSRLINLHKLQCIVMGAILF